MTVDLWDTAGQENRGGKLRDAYLKGADGVLVLTEWDEFKFLEWEMIYKIMRKPAWVFDSRIFLDSGKLKDIGFKVWTLGRQLLN